MTARVADATHVQKGNAVRVAGELGGLGETERRAAEEVTEGDVHRALKA